MNLAIYERMELLGNAARAFLGTPVERSEKTGAAMLFEQHLLEQMLRVQQPPKMGENVAVLASDLRYRQGKATSERVNCQIHGFMAGSVSGYTFPNKLGTVYRLKWKTSEVER